MIDRIWINELISKDIYTIEKEVCEHISPAVFERNPVLYEEWCKLITIRVQQDLYHNGKVPENTGLDYYKVLASIVLHLAGACEFTSPQCLKLINLFHDDDVLVQDRHLIENAASRMHFLNIVSPYYLISVLNDDENTFWGTFTHDEYIKVLHRVVIHFRALPEMFQASEVEAYISRVLEVYSQERLDFDKCAELAYLATLQNVMFGVNKTKLESTKLAKILELTEPNFEVCSLDTWFETADLLADINNYECWRILGLKDNDGYQLPTSV